MNPVDAAALAAQAAPGGSDTNAMFFPMLIIIAVLFYFLILRPQRREQKQAQEMRENIQRGDRVKSIGGIYGSVTAVDTTRGIVKVKVDKNVELEFDKGAIATVIRKDDEKSSGEQAASK